MRKFSLVLLPALLLVCGIAQAQFCSVGTMYSHDPTPDVAITDVACPTYNTDPILVTGTSGFLTKVTVRINITHTWDSDVDIFVQHPDGTNVEAFDR